MVLSYSVATFSLLLSFSVGVVNAVVAPRNNDLIRYENIGIVRSVVEGTTTYIQQLYHIKIRQQPEGLYRRLFEKEEYQYHHHHHHHMHVGRRQHQFHHTLLLPLLLLLLQISSPIVSITVETAMTTTTIFMMFKR